MTTLCRHALIAVAAAWLLAPAGAARAAVTRDILAYECRFDLVSSLDTASLLDGSLLDGDGWVSRVAWLPVESQACTYVVHASVTHYCWTDVAFRFVPDRDVRILWQLSGRFQSDDSNTVFRQVVEWRDPSVEGATLTTQFVGAVTSSHDDTRELALNAEAGRPVVVRIKVRAVPPAGFAWMHRIEATDTPAHRAMAHFKRGVSLGNDLEAPRGHNWGAWYTPADLRHIAKEGFDHVRLPVAWHEYTGPPPAYAINGPIFIYVDRILSMALTNRLAVILNLHHFSGFMDDPAAETARFISIWRQLAARYSSAPPTVAFELLNEPNSNAVTSALNPIYHKAIAEIRKTNPDRTVFLDPGGWGNPAEVRNMWLPDWDSNVVVTVHCYEPYIFTHQGAPWAMPFASTTNITYPGPPARPIAVHAACTNMPDVLAWIEQYNGWAPEINPCSIRRLSHAIASLKAWSDYYGRPVHFGEFGCHRLADPASRSRYLADVRKAIEGAGLAWAVWDWKAGFAYWNYGAARAMPGLREALFGK
jgi:endoglucanase